MSYAVTNFMRIFGVIKAVNDATRFVMLKKDCEPNRLNTLLMNSIMVHENTLGDENFVIEAETVRSAVDLNHYFIKHLLAIQGYTYDVNHSLGQILNDILE